ncbi:NF-X1 type zinc finger protein, partial [Xylaria flabelliformis]
ARRPSKSSAPDLPTRIHEDISNGQYECVICTNEVLRNSRVWSCSICWTATHMSCVKKWFTNRIKPPEHEQQPQPQVWRCPGCNSTMNDEPGVYHCWCGKDINPKPVAGLPPHSCGQTCSKPRGTCPHPCPLQCHAGPCPPCLLMGPSQPCFCGKNVSTKRCGETDYTKGWSCHKPCGDLLACGEHECQKECHSGLCGSCEVPVASRCYCGKETQDIPCDALGEKLESYDYGRIRTEDGTFERGSEELETWFVGSFKCGHSCGRPFDCGNHSCERECHPQDEAQAHCPFSPDVITHCHCGKTSIDDITTPRKSCLDPIPNCDKACNKLLDCGHLCQDNCHSGPCSQCNQEIELGCRCGRTKTSVICHERDLHDLLCEKVCRVQLNCGRHEHGARCCPAEKRAIERVTLKRRNKTTSALNEEFEAEHICLRTCGRELKCGRHRCQQMCHRCPCPSCLEAVFEEISCNCGRTVLQPPQPCGTRAPECRFDCTRARPCGHPQVAHNCHPDEVACPKCPFLVEKGCICGKKTLKNQPCWFEEPRCGLPCGKKLKCGTHSCNKLCHRSGACEDQGIIGSHCQQPCGKTRSCGHLDTEQCHAPYPCKEEKPCQSKIFVTCECQHRKQEVKCLATKAQPSPQRPLLKCDDECLRLQRNARLASALNIDPQTHTDDHVPYSDTTLKLYRANPQWAHIYEREFRVFAGDRTEKRLRFKPMKSNQRAFIHSLAEDFGFDSESSDPEPHRHVCLFKTPRFVSAPLKTLAQCAKIRASQDSSAQQSTMANDATTIPYNALLLTNPQFGLTIEELDAALKKEYAAHPTVKFHTSFLPSEEVVIRGSGTWTSQTLEASLTALKLTLRQTVRRLKLAENVFLCSVDDSLNVLRREESQARGEGGWSAVVGRTTARPKPIDSLASPASAPLRSKFIALRKEPKKKVEEEPVEEDWEAAAEKLDETTEAA